MVLLSASKRMLMALTMVSVWPLDEPVRGKLLTMVIEDGIAPPGAGAVVASPPVAGAVVAAPPVADVATGAGAVVLVAVPQAARMLMSIIKVSEKESIRFIVVVSPKKQTNVNGLRRLA